MKYEPIFYQAYIKLKMHKGKTTQVHGYNPSIYKAEAAGTAFGV